MFFVVAICEYAQACLFDFLASVGHLIKWIKSGVNSGVNSSVNSGVNCVN